MTRFKERMLQQTIKMYKCKRRKRLDPTSFMIGFLVGAIAVLILLCLLYKLFE